MAFLLYSTTKPTLVILSEISCDSTPLTLTITVPFEAEAVTFFTPEISFNALVILPSHPPQLIPETLNSKISAFENNPMRRPVLYWS